MRTPRRARRKHAGREFMGDMAIETVASGLGPLALRLLTLPFRILSNIF